MAAASLHHRLTALDAAFLYLEKPTAPMHIGGITLLGGRLPVGRFVQSLESKLHLLPRYRQRLVVPPLNIGHPTWESDPDFDIENHVIPMELAKPGSDAQLRREANKLFAQVLMRDKPLWKIYVIHGLEGDRTALVSLVHHAMVDGVSGVELLKIIMDPSPAPPEVTPAPYEPRPLPSTAQVLADTSWDNVVEQLANLSELQRNAVGLASRFSGSELIGLTRHVPGLVGGLLRPTKRLPFNTRRFSGKRKLSWSTASFAEIRGIRSALGGTVNDVVLAGLGGAVRRYLEHHKIPIGRKQTLRVMVPVSVRHAGEQEALGNRVSLMPVDVPLGVEDPVACYEAVADRTNMLKKMHVAELLSLGTHLWAGAPAALQAMIGSAAFAPRLQGALSLVMPFPGLHMVCTNVPGPQIPLYCVGQKVDAHYPLLPVAPGMGLALGVFSYNQMLHFGFIADDAAAPDVARFNTFFDRSLIALRKAAGVPALPPVQLATMRRAAEEGIGEAVAGEANGAVPPTKRRVRKAKAGAKQVSARMDEASIPDINVALAAPPPETTEEEVEALLEKKIPVNNPTRQQKIDKRK